MLQNVTVVDYYGSHNNSRCGYCSQADTCQSYGMWADCMTVQDYQDLIDRGWRRSGHYCYKPNNKETCCPSYTIKCDAMNFRLSKSNKKLLKRFNAFLKNGSRAQSSLNDHDMQNIDVEEVAACDSSENGMANLRKPISTIDIAQIQLMNDAPATTTEVHATTDLVDSDKLPSNSSDNSVDTNNAEDNHSNRKKLGRIAGADPTKPLRKKAKLVRAERRKEKLEVAALQGQSKHGENGISKPANSNQEATLQSFMETITTDGIHTLKVKLVPSSTASSEEAFNIYRRYQMAVHKDPPEKLTRKSFENFLTRSPLQVKLLHIDDDAFDVSISAAYELYKKYQMIIHNDPPESISEFKQFLCHSPMKLEKRAGGPSCGYGSFHQQYWLDNRLIAVGVIDILPKCVSSVYFFYDPEYNFLSLGTYGTLRELLFVQELNAKTSSLKDYYMGFYIDCCPKMRYKGNLKPSYLLCSEVNSWHLLCDDILDKLKISKYQRFNPDNSALDVNKFNPETDLNEVRLLLNRKYCVTFSQFKAANRDEDLFELMETICEYGDLVGKQLSKRVYFYYRK